MITRLRRMPLVDWGMIAGLVTFFVLGVVGAIKEPLRPDWSHWVDETQYLAEHGVIASNSAMYGYLPGAFLLLMPFAYWLPHAVGAPLLGLSNVACTLGTAWLIRKYWIPIPDVNAYPPGVDRLPQRWRLLLYGEPGAPAMWRTFAGPLLSITAVYHFDVFFANQLSLWWLMLVAGGLTLVRFDRPWLGGFLLGAANVVKPLAGLLMIYCAAKRQWRAVLGWGLGLLVLDVFTSAVYWGPREAFDEHLAWQTRARGRGHRANVEIPLHLRKNQASSSVLGRWLRPIAPARHHWIVRGEITPDIRARHQHEIDDGTLAITFTPIPADRPEADTYKIRHVDLAGFPRLAIADLSTDAVMAIWMVLSVLVAAGLFWVSRHRYDAVTDQRWWWESSLWILAVFWFTPYLYHNYFVWTFPAVAVIAGRVFDRPAGLSPARRRFALVAMSVWCGASLIRLLGYWPLEYYGAQFGPLLLLAAGLIAVAPPARQAKETK